MEIINYKFVDFVQRDSQLISDYMEVLSSLSGIPNFVSGRLKKKRYGVESSLTELTFGEVNKIKRLVMKSDLESVFESIATAYHYPVEKVPELRISVFYGCLNFIAKEIKHIVKVENHRYKVIPSKYDGIMEEAGIEKLEKFGEMVVVDQMADGKMWDYEKVEALPYMTVHAKIWLETEKTNINIRKEELMNLPQ